MTRGCKPHKDTCNFEHTGDVHAFVAHNLETIGLELKIAREVNQVLDSNAVSKGKQVTCDVFSKCAPRLHTGSRPAENITVYSRIQSAPESNTHSVFFWRFLKRKKKLVSFNRPLPAGRLIE